MNTRAVAGTQHTLTCMIENFNSTGIPLLYMWWKANQNISTCTSEQCVIPDVQFIDARTDYRCEVRRHDDNTVIAISDDTSLEVSSKLSLYYVVNIKEKEAIFILMFHNLSWMIMNDTVMAK